MRLIPALALLIATTTQAGVIGIVTAQFLTGAWFT